MKRVTKLLRQNIILILILIVGILLRFAGISYIPPSLNWDEISHGYNAYSILKTGKDEWGEIFPIIFRAYGDYKLPVYIYLTAISEAIFGLNLFAVRLVSIIAGIITIFFTYLLSKKLLNKKIAIFSSLLVAISPWSLFLSRGAFEANLALAFIVSGFYFLIRALSKKDSRFQVTSFLLSALLLGLSLWTYNSARVFVPMMLVITFVIYRKECVMVYKKSSRFIIASLLLFAIFFVPMAYQLIQSTGQARYSKVTIFDEGAIARINNQRSKSNYSPAASKLIYNKATYAIPIVVVNWFSHYNPDFLFFEGGDHFQFSIPGHGLIFAINLPFFLIGLFAIAKRRSKADWFILSWLLLAPIAASITREAPHTLRSIIMIPALMIIISIGLLAFWDWLVLRKKYITKLGFLAVGIYLLLIFASLEQYMDDYLKDYRNNYSWSWQYGYEQVVDYARENYDKYDKIIVTKAYGEPHEFFLFYLGWDPGSYRTDPNLVRFEQTDWYWVDSFDKFYFVNDWQIKEEGTNNYVFSLESKTEVDCTKSSCLLITSPENVPEGWKLLETVKFLDSITAFEIYKN